MCDLTQDRYAIRGQGSICVRLPATDLTQDRYAIRGQGEHMRKACGPRFSMVQSLFDKFNAESNLEE